MNCISFKKLLCFLSSTLFIASPFHYALTVDTTSSTHAASGVSRDQALKTNLEERLLDLTYLFERSMNYASDEHAIEMLNTLSKTARNATERLAKSATVNEILPIYQQLILALEQTRDDIEPVQMPTPSPSDEPLTPSNAPEKLDDALHAFTLTHALNLIKKSTKDDAVRRVFLKTLSHLFYNLAYSHLSITQQNDEHFDMNTNDFAKSNTFKDNFKLMLPFLSLDAGKLGIDLAIDEIIPAPDASQKQQWAELLIPMAVAYGLAKVIVPNKHDLHLSKSPLRYRSEMDLISTIFGILTITRFYLKPNQPLYKLANAWALISPFVNKKKLMSLELEYVGTQEGLINLAIQEGPGALEKIKWPSRLHPKPRRKTVMRLIGLVARKLNEIRKK